jgi:hypothetical protein
MTSKQRVHAKEHGRRFKSPFKLLDELTSVVVHADSTFARPDDKPIAIDDFVRAQACSSQGVFTGLITSATSNPTEDGTFLFTDYEVRVGDRFRMPLGGSATPRGSLVTVTRAGGKIVIDGVTVRAEHGDYPALRVGARYCFFVNYIDATASFITVSPDGLFAMRGERSVTVRPSWKIKDAQDGFSNEHLLQVLKTLKCR